ncbi:hypothetical protein QYF36_024550 [Acer negundo]|nr:hypothetical protein QYF36_024550 [Acer negundo]
MMLEVESVQSGTAADNKKLCGCFFICRERYTVSREMARMLKGLERLLKAGDIAEIVDQRLQSCLTRTVEHIPGPWVGKTTLVKNLNNKLKGSSSTSTQHFGVVIWATVSKKLDLRKVLIQIAERLNLEVGTGERKMTTSEHIEPVARAVARECSGLPLAIITVGKTMRGKEMIELWEDALHELRRSFPSIKGLYRE